MAYDPRYYDSGLDPDYDGSEYSYNGPNDRGSHSRRGASQLQGRDDASLQSSEPPLDYNDPRRGVGASQSNEPPLDYDEGEGDDRVGDRNKTKGHSNPGFVADYPDYDDDDIRSSEPDYEEPDEIAPDYASDDDDDDIDRSSFHGTEITDLNGGKETAEHAKKPNGQIPKPETIVEVDKRDQDQESVDDFVPVPLSRRPSHWSVATEDYEATNLHFRKRKRGILPELHNIHEDNDTVQNKVTMGDLQDQFTELFRSQKNKEATG